MSVKERNADHDEEEKNGQPTARKNREEKSKMLFYGHRFGRRIWNAKETDRKESAAPCAERTFVVSSFGDFVLLSFPSGSVDSRRIRRRNIILLDQESDG